MFAHFANLVFLTARTAGADEILQQLVEIVSEHGVSVASVGVGIQTNQPTGQGVRRRVSGRVRLASEVEKISYL